MKKTIAAVLFVIMLIPVFEIISFTQVERYHDYNSAQAHAKWVVENDFNDEIAYVVVKKAPLFDLYYVDVTVKP